MSATAFDTYNGTVWITKKKMFAFVIQSVCASDEV